MKRFKFYVSMVLALSILASMCTGVIASDVVEYNVSWILKPSESVQGFVYDSTPYGFIVKDWAWDGEGKPTTSIIDDNGFLMPPNEVIFDAVSENGYIAYVADTGSGVMDVEGNTIIPEGKYEFIEVLDETHFLCTKKYPEGEWGTDWGIFDAEGNAYVDYGTYDSYEAYDGTVVVSEMDESTYQYSCALIDYDGNVLVDFGECEYIRPLKAKDRYIAEYKDDEKSYLRHIDGRTLATFESYAFPMSVDCIYVSKYDEEKEAMHFWYYNYDGELISELSEEDLGGDVSGYLDVLRNNAKYFVALDENYRFYVSDKDGNCVYSNDDVNVQNVFNDKFIYVYNKEYNDVSLLEMNGNTVIPFGKYNKISYCEELDIYAFDNGENIDESICVGKIVPITVKVDGAKLEFDQNPVAIDGRTLLPLRAVFDALGASVDWDQATQTVTSKRGDIEVKVTIGSDKMYVNGEEKILDVPAQALNNRSLVPVRAVGEAFKCNVDWDGATFTVDITK